MSRALLTINAGSSSIKIAVFTADLCPILSGQIERIGSAPCFAAHDHAGALAAAWDWPKGETLTHEDLFADILPWIDQHLGDARLVGIGHRVVHGGATLTAPCIVTPAIMALLDSLIPLAPLHQPHSLNAIRAVSALRPHLPQIACFDTSFHHTQPRIARLFAVPRALSESGVQRYGFHGLSYEFIAARLRETAPDLAAGRVIVAHLGNGASLCALHNGASIDTTMGFTALDGLPMGTRCGTIDPGVLLYLQQSRGMDAAALEHFLYHDCGLLGVSGVSADMRVLLASADPHAAEAVALFCYQIARQIGALTASLGGLDGLIFTAGIGEHAPPVRHSVCARLGFLGAAIDTAANSAGAAIISTPHSRISIRVIATNEEAMIAQHTSLLVEQDLAAEPVA